jgi:hypothetical protein
MYRWEIEREAEADAARQRQDAVAERDRLRRDAEERIAAYRAARGG